MPKNLNLSTFALILLIVIENLLLYVTHRNHVFSQGKNSSLFVLTGLAIAFTLLARFYKKSISIAETPKSKANAIQVLVYITLFAFSAFYIGQAVVLPWLEKIKIDRNNSDIVPMIQYMEGNFMKHISPYKPVNFFGTWGTPTYLPMHWLPFIIPDLLGIDFRWLPYTLCAASLLIILARALRKTQNSLFGFLFSAATFYALWIIPNNGHTIITDTIEILIACYYMFMIVGCNMRKGYFAGIFIAFCLLSRFSLVFWVPLYAFILFTGGQKKILLQAAGTAFVWVLLLYVVPFLSNDWGLLTKGQGGYLEAAKFEWGRDDWNGLPLHLYSGVGFAYYFLSHLPSLDLEHKIKLFQKFQLALPILTSIGLGTWYYFNKRKIDFRIFLMVSFKAYFTVFLFFIQVPYIYLMSVGNLVSIAMLLEQCRYKILPDNNLDATN